VAGNVIKIGPLEMDDDHQLRQQNTPRIIAGMKLRSLADGAAIFRKEPDAKWARSLPCATKRLA
jgi:hypothetical protein